MTRYPVWAHVLLLHPARVEARLLAIRAAGLVREVPNPWQVALGVLRMTHRLVFRADTVGTSSGRVRSTWRARLLHHRALRLPFLLRERAVAPLDMSGLLSSRERILRHLLAAHHDGDQFAYDLQMLAADPGALDELCRRAREVVDGDGLRATWLRDLAVFEGYHESLCQAAERARGGDLSLPPASADDPDVSFFAYLAWCARQPETPAATWEALAAGRFSLQRGLQEQRA